MRAVGLRSKRNAKARRGNCNKWRAGSTIRVVREGRREQRGETLKRERDREGRQTKKNATQCGGDDDVGDAVNGLQTSAMSRKCKKEEQEEE